MKVNFTGIIFFSTYSIDISLSVGFVCLFLFFVGVFFGGGGAQLSSVIIAVVQKYWPGTATDE